MVFPDSVLCAASVVIDRNLGHDASIFICRPLF